MTDIFYLEKIANAVDTETYSEFYKLSEEVEYLAPFIRSNRDLYKIAAVLDEELYKIASDDIEYYLMKTAIWNKLVSTVAGAARKIPSLFKQTTVAATTKAPRVRGAGAKAFGYNMSNVPTGQRLGSGSDQMSFNRK